MDEMKCIFCGAGQNSLYSIGGEAERESSFNYNPFDRVNKWTVCSCCGRRQPLFPPEKFELRITGVSSAGSQKLTNETLLPLTETDEISVNVLENGSISRSVSVSIKGGYISCSGETFELNRLPVIIQRYFPVPTSQAPLWEEMTITLEIISKGEQ